MSTEKKNSGYKNRGVTKQTEGIYNSLIIQKNGVIRAQKMKGTRKKRKD